MHAASTDQHHQPQLDDQSRSGIHPAPVQGMRQ